MTEEKWEQIKEMTNKNFEVIESSISDVSESHGGGYKDTLIFEGPLGKIKLEYIVKPLVVGKETQFSKRAGQETKVDYVLSETEKVKTFLAFKWEPATEYWVEMESSSFE